MPIGLNRAKRVSSYSDREIDRAIDRSLYYSPFGNVDVYR